MGLVFLQLGVARLAAQPGRGLTLLALIASVGSACSGARPRTYACAAPAGAGPTRSLTLLFWHQGRGAVALDLRLRDQALGRRLRIRPPPYIPAVAGSCHAAIPVGAVELRACAAHSARCTDVALPAEGDLWVQLDVSDPDSIILVGAPEPYPPGID